MYISWLIMITSVILRADAVGLTMILSSRFSEPMAGAEPPGAAEESIDITQTAVSRGADGHLDVSEGRIDSERMPTP